MPAKFIFLGLFCTLFWGCGDNYFPEKEIQYKNARVTWYYRFLGDNRRDFVEVSKGFRQKIVMNCIGLFITDINIVNDALVIKTHGETPNGIYEFEDNGLGIPAAC